MGEAAGASGSPRRGGVDRAGRRGRGRLVVTIFDRRRARVHVVGRGRRGHERSGATPRRVGRRRERERPRRLRRSSRRCAALGVTVAVGHDARERRRRRRRAVVAGRRERQRGTASRARARGATVLSRAEVLADVGAGATGDRTDRDARQDHGDVDDGARDGRRRSRRRTPPRCRRARRRRERSLGQRRRRTRGRRELRDLRARAPHALGLLNVEADHLDHYGTLAALESAFAQLIDRTTGPVVIWSDDAGCQRVARPRVTRRRARRHRQRGHRGA